MNITAEAQRESSRRDPQSFCFFLSTDFAEYSADLGGKK